MSKFIFYVTSTFLLISTGSLIQACHMPGMPHMMRSSGGKNKNLNKKMEDSLRKRFCGLKDILDLSVLAGDSLDTVNLMNQLNGLDLSDSEFMLLMEQFTDIGLWRVWA